MEQLPVEAKKRERLDAVKEHLKSPLFRDAFLLNYDTLLLYIYNGYCVPTIPSVAEHLDNDAIQNKIVIIIITDRREGT